MKIPPHILWPGIILGLLTMSLATGASIIIAALSDDGVQVVDDYYQRAVNWDQEQEKRLRVQQAGWQFTLESTRISNDQPTQAFRLHIVDRDENPVDNIQGMVEFRRPNLSAPVATTAIKPMHDEPGVYLLEGPVNQAGLWDFVLYLQYHDTDYLKEMRRNIMASR